MTSSYTAVRQIRRPDGPPAPQDFRFITAPLPDLADGEVLVRNLWLSVDPYMREFMDVGGWDLGFGLEGRSIGQVIASRHEGLAVGTLVFHRHGWATHSQLGPNDTRRPIEVPPGVPLSAFLGILGGTGLTAYVGLTRIACLQPGENVFITAAAGAVGSAAGQIARLLGASQIIGSTGSDAKASYLTGHLGFDTAINYRAAPITEQLAKAAPSGIDVCFDNVGGDHLAAAIGALRDHGRIAWCGAVGQYNNLQNPPTAPRNLFDMVEKNLRLEGFLVRDHLDATEEFEQFLTPHIQSGRISVDETVIDGFTNIVEAFQAMLRGENTGKMLVRLPGEPGSLTA